MVFQGARLFTPHLNIWSLTLDFRLQLLQGPKLGHFRVYSLLELFDRRISYLREKLILFIIGLSDASSAHNVALIVKCEFLFGGSV